MADSELVDLPATTTPADGDVLYIVTDPGGTPVDKKVTVAHLVASSPAVAGLAAHIADTSDAHDASAVSITDAAGDFTATDVEGALAELQADAETDAAALASHLADTSDAHDASAVSFAPAGGIAATDVQGAIVEDAADLAAHLADTGDAHDASAISYAGGTGMAATDVEAAIDELATEKGNLVNTDADPGRTIYVGTIDPDVSFTPAVGDVWIDTT